MQILLACRHRHRLRRRRRWRLYINMFNSKHYIRLQLSTVVYHGRHRPFREHMR